MIGLLAICLTIGLGLYATDRISARCRDEQWRIWMETGRRGTGPDGLDRYGNSLSDPPRYERIPD